MSVKIIFNEKNYLREIKSLKIGKKLPDAIYIHLSQLECLQEIKVLVNKTIPLCPFEVDIIKIYKNTKHISFLSYPYFWDDDFPVLKKSFIVNLESFEGKLINYRNSKNPPILHRKELFISKDDSHFNEFKRVTERLEELSLFDNNKKIGFLNSWVSCLEEKGMTIENGKLRELYGTR